MNINPPYFPSPLNRAQQSIELPQLQRDENNSYGHASSLPASGMIESPGQFYLSRQSSINSLEASDIENQTNLRIDPEQGTPEQLQAEQREVLWSDCTWQHRRDAIRMALADSAPTHYGHRLPLKFAAWSSVGALLTYLVTLLLRVNRLDSISHIDGNPFDLRKVFIPSTLTIGFGAMTATFLATTAHIYTTSFIRNRHQVQGSFNHYLRNPNELGERMLEGGANQDSIYAYAGSNERYANLIRANINSKLQDQTPPIALFSYEQVSQEIRAVFLNKYGANPAAQLSDRIEELLASPSSWTEDMCRAWSYIDRCIPEAQTAEMKEEFTDYLAQSTGCSHGRNAQILHFFRGIDESVAPTFRTNLRHIKNIDYLQPSIITDVLSEMAQQSTLSEQALRKVYVDPTLCEKVTSSLENLKGNEETPNTNTGSSIPKHGKMSGRLFEQFLAQLVEHVRNVEEVAPEELSTAINAFQERARQMQILRDRQALKVTLLDLIEALPLEVSNEEVEQIVSNITQLL